MSVSEFTPQEGGTVVNDLNPFVFLAMLRQQDMPSKEFVYLNMLAQDKPFYALEVPPAAMHVTGTPAQLVAYCRAHQHAGAARARRGRRRPRRRARGRASW